MKAILQFVAIATAAAMLWQSAIAQSGPCRQVNHDRDAYTVCEVDLRKNAVRLREAIADEVGNAMCNDARLA